MDLFDLTPNKRDTLLKIEAEVRESHRTIVQNMTAKELRSFNQTTYKDLVSEELKVKVPFAKGDLITSTSQAIINALFNERNEEIRRRKRTPVRQKTDASSEPKHDEVLAFSEVEKTIENIDAFFSTQNEPTVETNEFDDSLTIEKVPVGNVNNDNSGEVHIVNDSTPQSGTETKERNQKHKKNKKYNKKPSDQPIAKTCICDTIKDDKMTRCNLCQIWFHDSCVNFGEDDEVGFWVCPGCRLMPSKIANIESMLSAFMKKYEDTETKLAQKTEELVQAQEENLRLRERIKSPCPITKNGKTTYIYPKLPKELLPVIELEKADNKRKGTLLIGSSIIRDIKKDSYNIDREPVCIRGGRISDITASLLGIEEEYENIILQVGSNDCCSDRFNKDSFKDDYSILIQTAKSKGDNIVISSICPRLDDKFGHIAEGNEILSRLSSDENCLFVNNDDIFRNSRGVIRTELYNNDGIHLSHTGTVKLAEHLGFKCIVNFAMKKSNDSGSGDSGGQGQTNRQFRRASRRIPPQGSGPKGNDHHGQPLRSRGAQDRGTRWNRQANGSSRQSSRRADMSQTRNNRGSRCMTEDEVNEMWNEWYMRGSREDELYRYRQAESEKVKVCWYCGESNHMSKQCRVGTYVTCWKCNRDGHKERHCHLFE